MRVTVILILMILTAQPVLARGHHQHHGGEADGSGDSRRGAYGKAKVEERDKLIVKLKNMSICRGC
jgi:hypothetical protein